ncbi:hypothetical protein OB2597_06385 [Pseudooceanicola batsensis HTCC2597]|uniref:Uncharacterized protein n=1 Tax=Pseudooceanicola batsensis (strain ATCC BAA-863 / DSM 15984 / KCTC 12145 / HTCC2597) TaxID=252305 RepID=A3TTB2_PSEBH|nr:hypothetical protein [Pseudooceanicola batsensis]EAQ04889.1 hypothetical protein OB2597_06385 [Pseudooceanicola batsensis HTCC2597]
MTESAFNDEDFNRRTEEAREALRKAFGGKPDTLRDALKRAGRRLPSRARKAGEAVLAAQDLAGHPKLRQQIDPLKVDRELDRLIAGARGIDRNDRRRGWMLGALASLAFNFLLLFVLWLLFALWQGWV